MRASFYGVLQVRSGCEDKHVPHLMGVYGVMYCVLSVKTNTHMWSECEDKHA